MSKLRKIKCTKVRVPVKMLFHDKKKIYLVILVTVVVGAVIFFKSEYLPDLYFISFGEPIDDVTCHYSRGKDALMATGDGLWPTPAARSIFFHDTSCRGDLTARQVCSVESTARIHPRWQIHVLFSGSVNASTYVSGNMALLNTLSNVHFSRVHLLDYAKGTPLEALVFGGALNRSRWRYSHTGDVLRYLTLYKLGGICLDFDAMMVQPLTSLARNWAARAADDTVASSALSFRKDKIGRMLATHALWYSRGGPIFTKSGSDDGIPGKLRATLKIYRDLRENYRGDTWDQNGPGTITRVLKKLCESTEVKRMSSVTCQEFEVYNQRFFYPVESKNSDMYFRKGKLFAPHAYIHHVSNKHTENLKVEFGSPYQKLAMKYCPSTYKAFGQEFGI